MNSRTGLTIKVNCKPNSSNGINSAQNRQVDRKWDRQEWLTWNSLEISPHAVCRKLSVLLHVL